MRHLPSGTVTFLFSDIEGSTRLLRALGDRYAEALADHRRLLRASFTGHGGVEVDTQGDSFFVAFPDATEALAAAEESQRALAGHAWPEGELRVRMGIHTGEPLVADDHYVGIDVHRGARIAAAAHGGQVLVSERTGGLIPDGAMTLRDLGAHPLKDLPDPERLFQLIVDGLPSSFPPLRVHEEAIEAAGLPDYSLPPADVPCPYKGLLAFEPEDNEVFFGRERLVEEIAARLETSGFLAVVGSSGSGKSSLVRAGVVPALGGVANIFSPGAHPLEQLAGADNASLLVVDQFEEVFTLCRDEEERSAFIDALLDASERARVVIALRADFYGHCAAFPRLASALEEHQALIGPMSEEELRRAIERPGKEAGLLLEPGVVEGILRDVAGQPGALPLLSHSLLETLEAEKQPDADRDRLPAVGRGARGDREDGRNRVPATLSRPASPCAQHLPEADGARRGDRRHPPPRCDRGARSAAGAAAGGRRGPANARRCAPGDDRRGNGRGRARGPDPPLADAPQLARRGPGRTAPPPLADRVRAGVGVARPRPGRALPRDTPCHDRGLGDCS